MKGITLEQLKSDKLFLIDFVNFFFGFTPYFYQENFLHVCFNSIRVAGKFSRQSGKSQIVAVYVLLRAILEKTQIIIVAPSQNQSDEMYLKIQAIVDQNPDIKALLKAETKREMNFVNGSRIISLPSGNAGRTILGYTADIIIAEESGVLEDELVNRVLMPMLASKGNKGQIIKIGTPLIHNHFYHSCFEDPNYSVINVTWRDCVKSKHFTQEFIDEQKATLTDIQFKTEYEADFVSSNNMFFKPELLDKCKMDYPLIKIL